MTDNNSQSRDIKANHFTYFFLTFTFWCFGLAAETGVFVLKINNPTEWANMKITEIEDFLFTICLLSIPSIIHLWIWRCLLKNENDIFCKFFDFTMFFSVASFTAPQFFFDVSQLVRGVQFAYVFSLSIGAFLTVLLTLNLVLMVAFVYYELTEGKEYITVSKEQEIHNPFEFLGRFLRWLFGAHWATDIRSLEKWNEFFKIHNLKSGISAYPFWRMLHFLAIFLSISYSFGFIFAYYDTIYRQLGNPAPLAFEKIVTPIVKKKNDENSPSDAVPDKPDLKSGSESSERQPTKVNYIPDKDKTANVSENKAQCFYFSKGSSLLQNLDEDNVTAGNDYQTRIAELNNHAFRGVLDEIRDKLVEKNDDKSTTSKSKILRIELNGYADEAKIIDKEIFSSNYELSSARGVAVQNEIYKGLRKGAKSKEKTPFQGWKQIEWVHYPHSNEKPKGSNCNTYGYSDTTQIFEFGNLSNLDTFARTVEVYIYEIKDMQTDAIWQTNDGLNEVNKQNERILNKQEEISRAIDELGKSNPVPANPPAENNRQPQLLDYLYLAGGIVTTNAAGDVKPATPFARFLISIIGFFQIFFLVGFFSTLISLREPAEEHKNLPPDESSRTAA